MIENDDDDDDDNENDDKIDNDGDNDDNENDDKIDNDDDELQSVDVPTLHSNMLAAHLLQSDTLGPIPEGSEL